MDFLLTGFKGPDMNVLRDMAQNSPAGVTLAELTPGRIVTISINKGTGDRSWTRELWTVVGSSGPYIALKGLTVHRSSDEPVIVNSQEHEFYDAHDMAAAMSAERRS